MNIYHQICFQYILFLRQLIRLMQNYSFSIRFCFNNQEERYKERIQNSRWISMKFWTLQFQVAKTVFRREFQV